MVSKNINQWFYEFVFSIWRSAALRKIYKIKEVLYRTWIFSRRSNRLCDTIIDATMYCIMSQTPLVGKSGCNPQPSPTRYSDTKHLYPSSSEWTLKSTPRVICKTVAAILTFSNWPVCLTEKSFSHLQKDGLSTLRYVVITKRKFKLTRLR